MARGAAAPIQQETTRPSGRQAPPPAQRTGRMAPPPPKPDAPWWSAHDPFHQPGETPSGGFVPNPPDYCDGKIVQGESGRVEWVCASYCANCPDRKVCTALKGYHAAVVAKNNGRETPRREWKDEEAE